MTYQEFLQVYPHDPKSPLRFGGQATIYLSTNGKGEKLAIKRAQVLTGKLDDKYSVLREFQLGQSLEHPNLAKYYGAYRLKTNMGEFDFGIMEFVDEGNNLLDLLESFPDEIKIKKVLLGVLEGLDYLHHKNVIHRDLKPNNILIANLGPGLTPIPKIIDFGVSKELNASETVASAIVGTFEYMAPEQINLMAGQKIQPNVDLWAFGVIVYRIFTGDMPFGSIENGDTRERIQNQVLDARLPTEAKDIPEPYRTIVMRCLVRDSKQRVQKAQELINILQKDIYEQDTYTVDSGTPSVHGMKKMGKSLEKPVPAPASTNSGEKAQSTSSSRSRRLQLSPLVIIVVLLSIMSGGGWFGYKWYQKKQIEAQIEKGVSHFLSSKYERALNELEPLAQNTYMTGSGFYVLGELNYHGYHPITKDSAMAEKYFQLASNNGCAEGLIHLGDLYSEGKFYSKDTTKAKQLYQQARRLLLADGSTRATRLSALGDLFLDNKAGDVDEKKAFDYYRQAAEAGFSYSMFRLGNCYENGTGTDQNDSKAFEWYQKAADLGDPIGVYFLGSAYERGMGVEKDPLKALTLYKNGANLYHEHHCMYNLGIIYAYGTASPTIRRDVNQGIGWLEKAANYGNAQAQFELAYLYQEGKSIPQNINKAVSLYEKSANQDYSPAQYYLGELYRQGRGVNKDPQKAFGLFKKAAAGGYVDAMNALGYLYDIGQGTPSSDAEAVKWYRRAAKNNHAQAQANLAYMFEMGEGVRTNLDSAVYYYNLAQKQGIEYARERMAWIKIQRTR